jgi:hypothetical protein
VELLSGGGLGARYKITSPQQQLNQFLTVSQQLYSKPCDIITVSHGFVVWIQLDALEKMRLRVLIRAC